MSLSDEIQALRLYDPDDVGADGYPNAWHHDSWQNDVRNAPIKNIVRALAKHRCERCKHPYAKGDPRIGPRGEWSPCDDRCRHGGPWLTCAPDGVPSTTVPESVSAARVLVQARWRVEAQWRILTVHHLNGVKYDCRWWNLAALCQRCHLEIQGKVVMERIFPFEHSDWFKPHAAGYYAYAYLGLDLTREEAIGRLDELLALERLA